MFIVDDVYHDESTDEWVISMTVDRVSYHVELTSDDYEWLLKCMITAWNQSNKDEGYEFDE